MKKLSCLLLLSAVLLTTNCSASDPEGPANTVALPALSGKSVRIVSHNLLFEYTMPAQESRRWSSRVKEVKRLYSKGNFDIIGTQEALGFQVNQLLESGEFGKIGRNQMGTSDSEGLKAENEAIFYRKSRFEVLEEGNFWYSLTPDRPASWSWDADHTRMCTWGKFKEKSTDVVFYVFNSHFHYNASQSRAESAKMLRDKVKAVAGDYPVFVTGDLNASSDTEAIQTLLTSGVLYDSRELAPEKSGPMGTFHGFGSSTPTARIDYVMVTDDVQVDYYRVINEELITRRFLSDHLPVVVDVTFK